MSYATTLERRPHFHPGHPSVLGEPGLDDRRPPLILPLGGLGPRNGLHDEIRLPPITFGHAPHVVGGPVDRLPAGRRGCPAAEPESTQRTMMSISASLREMSFWKSWMPTVLSMCQGGITHHLGPDPAGPGSHLIASTRPRPPEQRWRRATHGCSRPLPRKMTNTAMMALSPPVLIPRQHAQDILGSVNVAFVTARPLSSIVGVASSNVTVPAPRYLLHTTPNMSPWLCARRGRSHPQRTLLAVLFVPGVDQWVEQTVLRNVGRADALTIRWTRLESVTRPDRDVEPLLVVPVEVAKHQTVSYLVVDRAEFGALEHSAGRHSTQVASPS